MIDRKVCLVGVKVNSSLNCVVVTFAPPGLAYGPVR